MKRLPSGASRWRQPWSRRQWFSWHGLAALTGVFVTGARRDAGAQSPPRNVYGPIGVRPIINARGTITVLGGSRMSPAVRQAMDAATAQYVEIDELVEGVGRRLAELTGAEWGIVTSGCSAALTLATAAAVAGADPDKLAQLPDLSRLRSEVVVPAYSRSAYDHAIRTVGARVVEVRTREEFEFALGPRTAMVMVLAGPDADTGPLALDAITAIAKPRGIPVLVDAAAEELRVPNVHLARGASLVAYSGGKCLRGPQCAGLLLGQADLVRAAWVHSAPHHGFGRALKVGREEIVGMLTAVEEWGRRDHAAEQREWLSWLNTIASRLADVPAVRATIVPVDPNALSNRSPSLTVSWDRTRIPLTGDEAALALYHGTPRIAVSGAGSYLPFPPSETPEISLVPYQMAAGEEQVVADRLRAFFLNPPRTPRAAAEPSGDVSGTWTVTITFVRGRTDHTFALAQRGREVSGVHVGEFAQRAIGGTIDGSHVRLFSSHTRDGVRLNFDFSGTIQGPTMSGEVQAGEYGRAQWTARLVAVTSGTPSRS